MEEDKGSSGGLSGALGLASSFWIDLGSGGGGAFASSNISELMKSKLIVEKVLLNPVFINGKKFTLIEYYLQINQYRKKWKGKKELENLTFSSYSNRKHFSRLQDSIIGIVYKNLIDKDKLDIIQKDKKVTILTIQVLSNDEIFSKLFCESIAKETSDLYVETKSKKSRLNVEVLQKQVDSVKNELNFAIKGTAKAIDNVYNLNPAFNIMGVPSKKIQIDVQANTAILTNLVVQLELAKITLRKETPLIQLIDNPTYPLPKEKLGFLKMAFIGFLISSFLILSSSSESILIISGSFYYSFYYYY